MVGVEARPTLSFLAIDYVPGAEYEGAAKRDLPRMPASVLWKLAGLIVEVGRTNS